MAHWNSERILKDLEGIIPVLSVVNQGPGGDYDTDVLIVTLGGIEEKLFVRGFDPDTFCGMEPNRSDMNVSYVELTDGLDSRGGLKGTDYRLARAYIDVRQYLLNRGFEVVDTMDSYF